MEKRTREKRSKLIRLRVSAGELTVIQNHQQRSTDRSLSQYLRKLALNKPVTVKVRNASADDFLRDMLLLKALLQESCMAYTLAVQKLQRLQSAPECKSWLLMHESSRSRMLEQVSRIETLITQLYEQWLLK